MYSLYLDIYPYISKLGNNLQNSILLSNIETNVSYKTSFFPALYNIILSENEIDQWSGFHQYVRPLSWKKTAVSKVYIMDHFWICKWWIYFPLQLPAYFARIHTLLCCIRGQIWRYNKITRQKSLMIHSTSPLSRDFEALEHTYGRADVRTHEHSDHYRPGLWSASWVNTSYLKHLICNTC